MPRRTWSDAVVADLKPKAKRYAEPDPELSGHYVRVQPTGREVLRCRRPRSSRQAGLAHHWHHIVFTLEDAGEAPAPP